MSTLLVGAFGPLGGGVVLGDVTDQFDPEHAAKVQRELTLLADEQAALRRVAMLVARGVQSGDVCLAVCDEVGRLFGTDLVTVGKFEADPLALVVFAVGKGMVGIPVGSRWELEDALTSTRVFRTGRSARIDQWDLTSTSERLAGVMRRLDLASTVSSPIAVDGRTWGVITVSSRDEPLSPDAEGRLDMFSGIVASSIADAESRAAVRQLVDEQAALRRVATLVANAAPPNELFAAVTEEVGQLLQVDAAALTRYVSDDAMTIVALWGQRTDEYELGVTLPLGGKNLNTVIAETRRPTRIDTYVDASGGVGDYFRASGLRSAVGAPIIVDGRLWGVIVAALYDQQLLPPDSEARLTEFTELIATAIANAESRRELAASRTRIVNAADRTRRGIERDLHDGAQQRLVSLTLELRTAQATVPPGLRELDDALSRVAEGLADVQSELLEIARGIYPAILARGGLGPALRELARRSPIAVELEVRGDRSLPEPVVVASYYVLSEALTNAAKHAKASSVHVMVDVTEAALCARIVDDGVGGADPTRGSGLVGLQDRVEALGGAMTVESAVGAGTTLRVELPFGV